MEVLHLDFRKERVNRNIASKVSQTLWEMQKQLHELLADIKQHCDEQEFKWYRREFARIMAAIDLEVLDVIYRKDPTLMPPELSLELSREPDGPEDPKNDEAS